MPELPVPEPLVPESVPVPPVVPVVPEPVLPVVDPPLALLPVVLPLPVLPVRLGLPRVVPVRVPRLLKSPVSDRFVVPCPGFDPLRDLVPDCVFPPERRLPARRPLSCCC